MLILETMHMKRPSDLQLFNELFRDHHPRFVHFANTYVKDLAVAEDITNEAFIAYWSNKETLAPDSNIPAYILTIIKNKSINHLLEIRRKNELLGNLSKLYEWKLNTQISTLEAFDPNEIFSDEIKSIIDKALATLPPKTLKVFILSRYQNKSHKEIGELLGITTKGVEFHISKALAVLRIELKDYLPILIFLFYR